MRKLTPVIIISDLSSKAFGANSIQESQSLKASSLISRFFFNISKLRASMSMIATGIDNTGEEKALL